MRSGNAAGSPGTRHPCRALVTKELRESRWKIVLGVLLCGVTGAILGPTYEWLRAFMVAPGVPPLPGQLNGAIQAQFASYPLYVWSNWYGKSLYQYMVVLAIVYGAGLLAGEVTRRTSGFLFSKPVSRLQVMLAKYFVALAVLWLSAVAGTTAALLGTFAAGQEVPVGWFLTALPAALAGTAFLLALTTLASANASEPLRAGGVMVAGIALLVVLPALVRPLSLELARQVDFLRRMAGEVSFIYGRIDWGFLLQCLILSTLALLAAHRRLQAREL